MKKLGLSQMNINDWFLTFDLPNSFVNYLRESIDMAIRSEISHNQKLAGNISSSLLMEDPKDLIVNEMLKALMNGSHKKLLQKTILRSMAGFNWMIHKKSKMKPVLEELWVNFQKKHQFNPLHKHSGIFSFVIWMEIPYDLKDEYNLPWVKHSNTQRASNFVFVDSLGGATPIEVDKDYEGVCCFFPSTLQHMVYPFYTSDLNRISISGNISFAEICH